MIPPTPRVVGGWKCTTRVVADVDEQQGMNGRCQHEVSGKGTRVEICSPCLRVITGIQEDSLEGIALITQVWVELHFLKGSKGDWWCNTQNAFYF